MAYHSGLTDLVMYSQKSEESESLVQSFYDDDTGYSLSMLRKGFTFNMFEVLKGEGRDLIRDRSPVKADLPADLQTKEEGTEEGEMTKGSANYIQAPLIFNKREKLKDDIAEFLKQ